MSPTYQISKQLKRLIGKRPWTQEEFWLKAVSEVGRIAQAELDKKLHLPKDRQMKSGTGRGNPMQETKDAVGVHGYGQSLEVIEFCQRMKIILNPKEHWWALTRTSSQAQLGQKKLARLKASGQLANYLKAIKEQLPRTGYISGLEDSTHGWPRITNGIDVWIERADGTCIKGHRDWLRWDKRAKDLNKVASEAGHVLKSKFPSIPRAYLEKARDIWVNDKVDLFASKYFEKLGRRANLHLDDESEGVQSIAKAIGEYMQQVTAI